ncbi:MAG: hypothetical protein ONB12_09650 [candidate division KSB1 bacterium]|nr:hypothetical protein [candidate division KSB1 bacterium]
MQKENEIPIGVKLQLLRHLLTGTPPQSFLDNLTAAQMIAAHQFIWEKTLEIGIQLLGDKFSQSAVVKRIQSIEAYKIAAGCSEPQQRCETNACLDEHPECVHRKLKLQIENLCDFAAATLQLVKS